MVNISRETVAQTDQRLARVIKQSRLTLFEEAFAFEEFPLADFASHANAQALALVRDENVWSQLLVSNEPKAELFAVWRFHFPEGIDNSGFVGWLATHLKTRFGTGVFVICGQNSADGGIFDYWGCPWDLRKEVVSEVQKLASLH